MRNFFMSARFVLCASLIVLLLGNGTNVAWGQAKSTPKEVDTPLPSSLLFIGNSFFYYNNGLHSHVNSLVRAGDKAHKIRSTSATINGSGLSWHNVESYFDPQKINPYNIVDNEVIFNDPKRKLFDAAIMLDCSQCPTHPTLKPLFSEYVKKHSDTIRKHGTTPVLFMTWAYADKPEMTTPIAEAYTKAGKENNAIVIPAGLAFAEAVTQKPDINLYQKDKRHPSIAGTYLSACVTYSVLFKKSPVGNPYTAGLDKDVAKFLQTVAQDTVAKYQKK